MMEVRVTGHNFENSRHSFNIGPMGKVFKSSLLKPVSQFNANMAWIVLG
jgi:hypothetical protein